jgi:hypothetical protein
MIMIMSRTAGSQARPDGGWPHSDGGRPEFAHPGPADSDFRCGGPALLERAAGGADWPGRSCRVSHFKYDDLVGTHHLGLGAGRAREGHPWREEFDRRRVASGGPGCKKVLRGAPTIPRKVMPSFSRRAGGYHALLWVVFAATIPACVYGFYLPGVAPTDYVKGEELNPKVCFWLHVLG